MPGQGGMVTATKASGPSSPARNWNAAPSGIVAATPGASGSTLSVAPGAPPQEAAAGDDVPKLLDGAMRDGVRDRAGGKLEMRQAAAGELNAAAGPPSRPARWRRGSAASARVAKGRGGGVGWSRSSAGRTVGSCAPPHVARPAPACYEEPMSTTLTADQALDEFRAAGALLEGHFILSSGLHSPVFLQKMFVFQDPARTERLCRALAAKAREAFGPIDVVASPAVGGIVPGYETARWLGAKAIFVERENGAFRLRRGFEIAPGARVLMVEDIITTGLSSRECLAALAEHPGRIVGAACLIDRSGGKAEIGVPRVALATLDIPAYPADALPPELAALPAVKPGSRSLAGAA